jgi:hypothetical protein
MSGCRNHFLLSENLTTYATVLTLGETGSGTSRCYRCIDYLGMSKCCNNLLLYSVVTFCTVLAFGKTGSGTGRSYAGNDYLAMTSYANKLTCLVEVLETCISKSVILGYPVTSGYYLRGTVDVVQITTDLNKAEVVLLNTLNIIVNCSVLCVEAMLRLFIRTRNFLIDYHSTLFVKLLPTIDS